MDIRRFVPLLLAAIMPALLAGCGAGPSAQPVQTQAPAAAQPPAVAATGTAVTGRYTVVAARSSASYHAREKFVSRQLPSDAVGTTAVISGDLLFGEKGLGASTVSVDLRTLKSDEGRRDNFIQGRTLQTSQYPMAVFSVTGSSPAPLLFAEGQPMPFQITGTLKVHGVEKPLTWDATGTRQGSAINVKATTAFKLSDFQIQAPDIGGMLKVEDGMKLSIDLTLQPAG